MELPIAQILPIVVAFLMALYIILCIFIRRHTTRRYLYYSNLEPVLANLGFLFQFSGTLMLPSVAFAYYSYELTAGEGLILTSAVLLGLGFLLGFLFEPKMPNIKQSCLLLVLFYTIYPLIMCIPLLYMGIFKGSLLDQFVDCLFETSSAFSTTGLTLLDGITVPKSLILARGITEWSGGIGVVFILLPAFYPNISLSQYGKVLGVEKFTEDYRGSFLAVALVYGGYTLLFTLALILAGVDSFMALHTILTVYSTTGLTMVDVLTLPVPAVVIIFCLAELSRDKGGGLVSKKPPEEIMFFDKVCYPFWLLPWGKRTLVFDGLNLKSHTITFDILPDIEMFLREVNGSGRNLESYTAFLSHNLKYFETAFGRGQKIVKGLIPDNNFLNDFFSLFNQNSKAEKTEISTLLSPILDEATIRTAMLDLHSLQDNLSCDIKRLHRINELLIRTTQKHVAAINKKIIKIREKFENRIRRLAARIEKRTAKMRTKYDQKIIKVTEAASLKIQTLNEENASLQIDKERFTAYAKKCEDELSVAKANKNDTQTEHWTSELDTCEERLFQIEVKMQETNQDITNITSSSDAAVSKLKSEYVSKSEALAFSLRKLEAARDVRVKVLQDASEALEKSTPTILGQVQKLVETRSQTLRGLENLGYPIFRRKSMLIELPFYLVGYRQEAKTRFVGFPPSVVTTMSSMKKIKGVLRSFNVRSILQEVSMPISDLIHDFVDVIPEDSILKDRIMHCSSGFKILKSIASNNSIASLNHPFAFA